MQTIQLSSSGCNGRLWCLMNVRGRNGNSSLGFKTCKKIPDFSMCFKNVAKIFM